MGQDLNKKDSILEVFNIGKRYKNRSVLRNVSLNVKRGEAVGLLGPNGAGKTTCFYCVTGLISPDYGDVCIDGQDITYMPMYKRARLGIGYLPQEASIFRTMTVENNQLEILETMKITRAQRKARAAELLEKFGLSHVAKQKAITLSGGERRKLEIARSLVQNPSILLLDEPFAGVDPIAVSDIQQVIKQLQQDGYGILITDHNVRETLNVVDRAYIMADGKILTEGTKDELINDPIARKVYLGEDFKMV
ncbi:MAG: LPS export ABC transporter ATP-binding protein [Kiritimatiellae bacterium]|nr:LPS export ABC transporter ATP-binding protein [Kiritimatiellia bacterium]